MIDQTHRVFIGFDQREDEAYRICLASLVRRTSTALHITALKRIWLQEMGWYTRTWREEDGKKVDTQDGKPFSTDFAFTRFLVPFLQNYIGWALFCDCDFLFRADVAELFSLADDRYAAMVVKHDHKPTEAIKMDGQAQQHYRRKNWSSLILWNCAHPAHMALTKEAVSSKPGSWLHGFEWLKDDQIGELPVEWNWLEGWSPSNVKPKAVHYTRGGPWFADYQDVCYAKDWNNERAVVHNSKMIDARGLKSFGNPFNLPYDKPRFHKVENV
jgi:lipopolysaccharide biosynthesis glycosyltransferase